MGTSLIGATMRAMIGGLVSHSARNEEHTSRLRLCCYALPYPLPNCKKSIATLPCNANVLSATFRSSLPNAPWRHRPDISLY